MNRRSPPSKKPPRTKDEALLEKERAARDAAKADPVAREQAKTEVEERPYLDTEGGE